MSAAAPGFRRRFGRACLLAGAWMVLGFLVLPMAIVVPVSLTDQEYLSLPQERLSLRHYAALAKDGVWAGAAMQSLVIAAASTFLAVILGTLCAIGCWRLSSRLSEFVRMAMLVPIIVPTIVLALAMYRLWTSLGLADTYPGVILAHAVVGIPYVLITVSASLSGFDPRQEQAARNLGASLPQAIRLVILPAVAPGVAAGALFAFTHSFDEVVIVLFLTSRAIYTLPKRIWDGIEDHVDPAIAAVATLLVLLTLVGLLVALAVGRRRTAGDGGA